MGTEVVGHSMNGLCSPMFAHFAVSDWTVYSTSLLYNSCIIATRFRTAFLDTQFCALWIKRHQPVSSVCRLPALY